MRAVTHALFAGLAAVAPLVATLAPLMVAAAPARRDIPLRPPDRWTVEQQDDSTIFRPPDVAEGKLYAIMVTMTPGTAGTLDEILAEGRRMIAEVGTFKAAGEPRQSRSDGGWDYKFSLGSIATPERSLASVLVAFKQGDVGGVAIVLADGPETLGAYGDAFADMVRAMGDTAATPTPAAPGVADLRFTVPAGWVTEEANGFPLLVREKHDDWRNYRFSLMVLPTEELQGSLREEYGRFWQTYIVPNFTTKVAPLPLMRRLESGYACGFDADSRALTQDGGELTVALYVVAHGGRAAPVLGMYSGPDWTFETAAETEIGEFLASARLPGATEERVALFAAADLAGDWRESSSEHANRVSRDGAYLGDATVTTGTYLELGADGAYSHTKMALRRGSTARDHSAGTWTVDDDELVLSQGGRYTLLGYGSEPEVGRFLVMGNYPNLTARLKYTNPRGILQASWLKAQ